MWASLIKLTVQKTLFIGTMLIALEADSQEQTKIEQTFLLTVHVATEHPDDAEQRIDKKIAVANEKFAAAGLAFEKGTWNELPEKFAVLANCAQRHRLKRFFRKKTINVYIVDEMLDPNPSRATKRAAGWQGRKPSGRLSGAHIEFKKKIPGTYIIITRSSLNESLAHELGHFFGLPHHKDSANLMSYGRERLAFNDKQLKIIRARAKRYVRKRILSRP